MTTAANIVLADALATPVNHTFIPMGKDSNGNYWFEDQSQSSAIGYWRLSINVKRPLPASAGRASSSDRVTRCEISIHEPTLETLGTADNGLTPPSTISHITRFLGTFILPERGVRKEREHMVKLVTGLAVNPIFLNAVLDLQPITG